MRSLTIAGVLLAAVVLLAGSTDAQRRGLTDPTADQRAPFWPKTKGDPVVDEWYVDVPWHQKLGTFAGNEIDQPLVLPYEALQKDDRQYCQTQNLTPEACMLELGINNILGARRIDTLYDPGEKKIQDAPECRDDQFPCIEVKLELSSFWTRSTRSGIDLQPRPFGIEPPQQLPPSFRSSVTSDFNYYRGYVITDGSTYAPQMPWYVSHYCDALYPPSADMQDPVCYADYFSPMNDGFNLLPGKSAQDWPKSAPWSVWPQSAIGHCKETETKCTLVMAGFDLTEVPQNMGDVQYQKYNDFLLKWFNGALQSFKEDFANDNHHFPWSGQTIDWSDFIYPRSIHNPFLGVFASTQTDPPAPPNCDPAQQTLNSPGSCNNTGNMRATHYLYPRKCDLGHLTQAAAGSQEAVDILRRCGLNYEFHHNGYWEQWPQEFWSRIWCDKADCRGAGNSVGIIGNQYGRTSFLFAGVPGMQAPVSFYKDAPTRTIYERLYNSSIFTLYLPITNVSDTQRAFRNYTDTEFYHTLLMSNHMESDPWEFAEGIRGKVLWHNEYRTQKMYDKSFAPARTFASAFKPGPDSRPFHGTTCDSCHVRNGSGVPINTEGVLDPKLGKYNPGKYNPYFVRDYTFTGEIRPMKLVFFDLQRATAGLDASRYSEPLSFPKRLLRDVARLAPRGGLTGREQDVYYRNKIMNFYGDSFHVTTPGYGYTWKYETANPSRVVVAATRHNSETNRTYELLQVQLGTFTISPDVTFNPSPGGGTPWPTSRADIDDHAIHAAINGGEVGFMLLNGRRLGNLGAIEAIPNKAIQKFYEDQKAALGEKMAGEIVWNAGSRDGVDGKVQKNCTTKSLTDCFIGRFGWIGDRVSLEDQVANAAFVEMNITTSEGYRKLYPTGNVKFPIRYGYQNCGPANKSCRDTTKTNDTKGNADLSEKDVQRMAAYARWLGSPTRSEFQVSQPDVINGEEVFRQVKCHTCHVIDKIEIDNPDDTMVSKVFRDRLAKRVTSGGARPFLSYLGTDLLMHDMGYLSQVGDAPDSIRDPDGVVKAGFENYVQKIRTPALKGLRFNRYVTDSHRNTIPQGDPACDFLLHDGRACDAVEAAFLHDGPAIKKLGMIEALNGLSQEALRRLRAFLYSL